MEARHTTVRTPPGLVAAGGFALMALVVCAVQIQTTQALHRAESETAYERASHLLFVALGRSDNMHAQPALREALTLREAAGRTTGSAAALNWHELSVVAWYARDRALAREACERALAALATEDDGATHLHVQPQWMAVSQFSHAGITHAVLDQHMKILTEAHDAGAGEALLSYVAFVREHQIAPDYDMHDRASNYLRQLPESVPATTERAIHDAMVAYGLLAGTQGGRSRYLESLSDRAAYLASVGAVREARQDLLTAIDATARHSHAPGLEAGVYRRRLAALESGASR